MIINFILLGIYAISQLYFLFLIASIIISWIPSIREIKLFKFVDDCAGWYLDIFRGKLVLGFLDIGPIFGFIIYETICNFIYFWIMF